MLFTTRRNLFCQLFTNKITKAVCCGIAAFNVLAAPSFAVAANPIFDASEYNEWGLDYPGVTPDTETQAPAERPAPQAPVAQNPAPAASAPTGGSVPQDIASSFEQAAVHVIVFYADGNHMRMPGWIVDTERRIILTFALLKDATKVHIGYPQVPTEDPDTMEGSAAVILSYDSNMDIAYLQAKSMPQQLANLSVSRPTHEQQTPQQPVVSQKPTAPTPPVNGGQHGGSQNGGQNGGYQGGGYNGGQAQQGGHTGGGLGGYNRPAQSQNPLVGQWYLQDEVNGNQIQIAVAFDAQGQFVLQMLSVDAYGNQNQDSNNGTYTVRGNTLILNSSEGVEQSNFWFENGLLYVQMVAEGTTLIFQPAS